MKCISRVLFAWADDVSLKSKRVKNWNFVARKHFTDLELADYCNLSRDIDKRILNDLLMSKMFLKYTESWHINVNAVASMTGNGRNKLRTYILPFCWVFYVRQAIKTDARDLVFVCFLRRRSLVC